MTKESSSPEANTDVAALAASAMASALTMFGPSGPFQPLGTLVSVSLLLVVFGYVWSHKRTLAKSIALSATIGLISIPIFGFALEVFLAEDAWNLLANGDPWNCNPSGSTVVLCLGKHNESQVREGWLMVGWFLVSNIVCAIDLNHQSQLKL